MTRPDPWSALWTQTFGDGPPVLWLHGLGESSLCFAEISRHPALARFRHRLVDLPGYGRSPWPSEAYRLDEAAAAIAEWLAPEKKPSVLIGHSMGGVLAMLVAERAPTQVRAVVNVDGNLSLGDCNFSGKAAAFALDTFIAQGFDSLRDAVYEGGAGPGEIGRAALRGYYASMRFADPRVFHRHALDLVELSSPEDLPVRLARLIPPALYLAGSPDGASPRSKELLGKTVARWQAIEPAGHWPFIDRPDDFAAAVASFLEPIR
jgi:pimeloyl-ACP methyl ester carboxylesterase